MRMFPFPEGGDVVECLHRRWNRNQQGGEYKYCTQEQVHTGLKHVVAPHDERQEADRQNRTNHSTVTEDGLTGVGGDDFRRDPQCRQQYDVDLRVSQEPEQVLVQDGRSTGHIQHLTADHNVRQVEGRAGHTVHHQQHHCRNQDWKRSTPRMAVTKNAQMVSLGRRVIFMPLVRRLTMVTM